MHLSCGNVKKTFACNPNLYPLSSMTTLPLTWLCGNVCLQIVCVDRIILKTW